VQLAHLCVGVMLLSTMVSAGTPFTVKVVPAVVFPGHTFRVDCRVPPQIGNRKVEVGIDGLGSSQFDISDTGPTLFTREFKHADCGVGPAYCAVFRNDGSAAAIKANVIVAGCDPDGSTK
jgi:hypothetical protein